MCEAFARSLKDRVFLFRRSSFRARGLDLHPVGGAHSSRPAPLLADPGGFLTCETDGGSGSESCLATGRQPLLVSGGCKEGSQTGLLSTVDAAAA
ncbi:hypothetical protein ZWY2020_039214 [Hordeum vulgare]|nr:hypothetical protein ZWY2020_039214 [Hordeum vulgare]